MHPHVATLLPPGSGKDPHVAREAQATMGAARRPA